MKLQQINTAADALGVTRQTVINWASKGLIPTVKIGKFTYTSIDDIEERLADVSAYSSILDAEKELLRKEIESTESLRFFMGECNKHLSKEILKRLVVNLLPPDVAERDKEMMISLLNENGILDVSQKFEITRSRVRQIITKMLRRMFTSNPYDKILELEKEIKIMKESDRLKKLKGVKIDIDVLVKDVQKENISKRAKNVLRSNGVSTIGELLEFSPFDIMHWRNSGRKTLQEIVMCLNRYGLTLKGNIA